MNTVTRRSLAVAALLTLLVACGSTPSTNYYLLSAQLGSPSGNHSPSVGIGPITMPEYLNRNGLVYNRTGNQLSIANYERWAEPLTSGVERVMRLNMASLLDTENIQSFPWNRSEQPDYAVEVSIQLLDANNTQATLVAEWVLQKPDDPDYRRRRLTQLYYDMPKGGPTPQNIAPAYSDLLLQLSKKIADAITADVAAAATTAG